MPLYPLPHGRTQECGLWITLTFLWMNEALQDLTSRMFGIDNGKVRSLNSDLSTEAQGRTWAFVYLNSSAN